jgi:CheY-like chemotaxis protein
MSFILVADDDLIFRTIMKHHLNQMGFEVIENESGIGVVAQIGQHHPVACLIDLVMDGKEGIETIGEILELAHRPKVVAVSSNVTYLEFATVLGADASLLKPFLPDKLKSTLNQLGIAPD